MEIHPRPRKTVFDDICTLGHDEDFKGVPPGEATSYRPGDRAKIEVMRQRVERGEELWHPDDHESQRDYGGYRQCEMRIYPDLSRGEENDCDDR